MLNLPQTTLNKIKAALIRKQSQVESELKSLKEDDVVLADALPESGEPGTDSFQADVHTRLTAMKNDLTGLLDRIKDSLSSIKKGTYGVCEKCKNPIEKARLEAMPTATVCISCSKKPSR